MLDKLADDDEIGVEQNELTELIVRKAQQNGSAPEQEAQHMMEHNHLPEWMEEIRRGKALASLVAQATVKDASGEVLVLDRRRPTAPCAEAPETEDSDADAEDAGEAPAEAEKA